MLVLCAVFVFVLCAIVHACVMYRFVMLALCYSQVEDNRFKGHIQGAGKLYKLFYMLE